MDLGSDEMGMVAAETAVDSGMTTAGMSMAVADSGLLPAGAILVGVMGDGMGMWGGGGNHEGGDSANNCSGGVQLFVNKHIT